MICNGCGGLVGKDCFNPQECEWIARDIERRDTENHIRESFEAELDQLRQRITELEQNKSH